MDKISRLTWDDYVEMGINVTNDYGEYRETTRNSIAFPNGWVASIVHPSNDKAKYSVAMCDYEGYFDWNILNDYGAVNGIFYCDSEEEIAHVLSIISGLGMSWDDFVKEGIIAMDSQGSILKSSRDQIVFPNGWVARVIDSENIINKEDKDLFEESDSRYCVSIGDLDGYFSHNIVSVYGFVDQYCNCDDEKAVARALLLVKSL